MDWINTTTVIFIAQSYLVMMGLLVTHLFCKVSFDIFFKGMTLKVEDKGIWILRPICFYILRMKSPRIFLPYVLTRHVEGFRGCEELLYIVKEYINSINPIGNIRVDLELKNNEWYLVYRFSHNEDAVLFRIYHG